MGLHYILLSFLSLITGLAFGIWFGVKKVVVSVPPGSPTSTLDLIGILSSFIGGLATLAAAVLAVVVYIKWHEQQQQTQVYSHKTRLAKNISNLKSCLNRLMYCPKDKTDEIHLRNTKLLLEISEVNSDIELYYILKGEHCSHEKKGDELDPTYDLLKISTEMQTYVKKQLENNKIVYAKREFNRIYKLTLNQSNEAPPLNAVYYLGQNAMRNLIDSKINKI